MMCITFVYENTNTTPYLLLIALLRHFFSGGWAATWNSIILAMLHVYMCSAQILITTMYPFLK
jgi:hypothetical protein